MKGVEVGPVIDGRVLEQALKHVRDAVDRGAKLLCGGKRLERQRAWLLPRADSFDGRAG